MRIVCKDLSKDKFCLCFCLNFICFIIFLGVSLFVNFNNIDFFSELIKSLFNIFWVLCCLFFISFISIENIFI